MGDSLPQLEMEAERSQILQQFTTLATYSPSLTRNQGAGTVMRIGPPGKEPVSQVVGRSRKEPANQVVGPA